MIIICPKCRTRLNLSDEKIKPEGTRFRCIKCQTVLSYKGKASKVPQDKASETGVEPSSTTPEVPEVSPPLVLSDLEIQPMNQGMPPSEQEDQRDKIPADETEEGRSMTEKREILKKIEKGRKTIKQQSPPVNKQAEGVSKKMILAGVAVVVIILILIGVFIFYPKDNIQQDQVRAPGTDKGVSTPPASTPQAGPQGSPTAGGSAGQPLSANVPLVITEENAVEMVKRSDALLKNTPVEVIVRKWTEENAAKYKMVGWQVKKIDEQKFLVSYTALDNEVQKGFYFDLDAQSGVVQDIAKNPELQKKYNIQYSR